MKRIVKYLSVGTTILLLQFISWQTPAIRSSHNSTCYTKNNLSLSDNFPINRELYSKYRLLTPDDTIPDDTGKVKLRYPFRDNTGNPYIDSKHRSGLFLGNPSNLSFEPEYNPKTNEYIFPNRIGSLNYRRPQTMSFDEFRNYDFEQSMNRYWNQRTRSSRLGDNFAGSSLIPQLRIPIYGFDKIFGRNVIDIKPSGTAELIFGINISNIENPSLPKRLQRSITFDFDEKIQMGVTGKIGDKMELGINYNTKATFDFENKTKLGYTGKEDEIIKSIEAGDVSLPLTGSLISGSQSLFGFKTELQFGKLNITSVFSQQKGESSEIEIEGGAQINEFKVSAGDYEANKHFFLAHYFRENYDRALRNLPVISSGVNITRIEVWVTNKTGNFEEARNIVAFMDLAEQERADDATFPSPEFIKYNQQNSYPDNTKYPTNNLYELMNSDYSGIRDINQVTKVLEGLATQHNFVPGQDYEKIENARLLSKSEYRVNEQLGYISLNSALNADEVLAVAFEYTVGGRVYRVGELSNSGVAAPNALVVKLLKGTNLTPKLPTWDLMMKNIYAIGAYQVAREDFELDVMYQNDQTGTAINYIDDKSSKFLKQPRGINGQVLIQVFNLDNLNSQLDPQPDGYFDFIEGVTINSSNGRIIFPVTEPFGEYLEEKIMESGEITDTLQLRSIADRYCFYELYDSTQYKALQIAEKNKFFLEGNYQSSSGSEIMLNAMNIPEGSVKVTANGAQLTEGTDYIVDYTLGRVTILNQGLLESGVPIKISLESQSLFNIGTKTMVGTHLDYKFSDNFILGGTILRLSEKPLTKKVNIGDEPIANTIWGLNGSYTTESPFLTRLVDKLPFIETKEVSSISIDGEFAHLIPGNSRAIGKNGVCFIDDFEGTKITIDIKSFPAWVLSSTPQEQKESILNNNLAYGFNRAKLAWYNIMPDLLRDNTATPDHLSDDEQSNHFVREVYEQEIFPNRESQSGLPTTLTVLNLAYYPTEKGPYNYDAMPTDYSAGINKEGRLLEPETRWGGIMRRIQTNDFESANIEFIEFWLMDPFVYDDPNDPNYYENGGDLFFNLGNISEDILKDSRKSFENGLPTTAELELVDSTSWGRVPLTQSLVNAFDNNPESRQYQDLGLDGLSDDDELTFFQSYLDTIASVYGSSSQAYQNAITDPSNDNYHYFRGGDYDSRRLSILQRYKKYNGLEQNSPTSEQSPEQYPTSGTLLPDAEDINRDNTLSENESYYQYRVSIRPQDLIVGKNYITDSITDTRKRKNNKETSVTWYQFKVPIYQPDKVIGNIQDFKSIRFLRMFLKNFNDSVHLRFGTLDLVRGEWRKYNFDLADGSENFSAPENYQSTFDVSAVNIEENGNRSPVNYVLPPGVDRVIDPSSPQLRQLNEQAIVLKVIDLEDGDAKAVYRNVNLDVRRYNKLEMWVHAEAIDENMLQDDEVTAFIRLGSDYKDNFYEYEIPLKLTPHRYTPDNYDNDNEADRREVWPDANRLEIEFDVFQLVKQLRNREMRKYGSTIKLTSPFTMPDPDKNDNNITVIGNPNLSNVKTIMIGIRNPSKINSLSANDDDGMLKSCEVWMNELRLTDFNDKGGWAANARVNTRLADFATVTLSGNTSKPGFGSIDQKVNERQKEEIYQYDISSNVELGKFFPKKTGVRIPMFVGFSETRINPEYNPLDPDIPLNVSLQDPELSQSEKDSIRHIAQDYTRRRSINFTNMKVSPQNQKEPRFYSISNFAASFAYSDIFARNINTEYDIQKTIGGSFSYNYNKRRRPIQPLMKSKSKILRAKPLRIIRDFNFNYAPSMIAFRTDMNRRYNALQNRNIENPQILIEPSFRKDFIWNRVYDLKWDFSRAVKFDFSANNAARIDEPDGALHKGGEDFYEKRDTVFQRILDGGRTTHYNHKIDLSWNVPINKLPLLDWTSLTARYNATYDWQTGPIPAPVYRITQETLEILRSKGVPDNIITRLDSTILYETFDSERQFINELDELIGVDNVDRYRKYFVEYAKSEIRLGNTIRNTNSIQLSSTFNMRNLYNKVSALRRINQRFGKGQKPEAEYEDVKFEREIYRMKKGRPRFITHKLGTKEGINVKVADEEGEVVNGEMEIVSENKIKFTPTRDAKRVTVEVTGKREVRENILKLIGGFTVNMLMGVKNISISYTENNGTVLPGYKPTTDILGMSMNNNWAPGVPFVVGMQDEQVAYDAIHRTDELLTNEPLLNTPFAMSHTYNLSYKATIEPIRDLKIDITGTRAGGRNFSEFWTADQNGNLPETGKNRLITGNFSSSFIALRTAFWEIAEDYSSQAFNNFKDNRIIIAHRLADKRPADYKIKVGDSWIDAIYDQTQSNTDPLTGEERTDGFPNGYGPVAQQVLIPAFVSAYADTDPNKVSLTGIPTYDNMIESIKEFFPMPNWRVRYTGLLQIDFFRKYFKSININHAYRCNYSVGSFTTNLYYDFEQSNYNDGFSYVIDELNGYFIPEFEVNTITIKEDFSPLINVDMTWNNSLTTKLEYKKARDLALSLNNNQIIESQRQEFVVGAGFRINEVKVPMKIGGKKKVFESDLNVRADFSLRDMVTIIRKLEENVDQITAGQRNIAIKLSADYVLSERFNLRFYYDQVINEPKISTSFRTSNTKVGISVRFTLIP